MTYESWRISFQSAESAARAAYNEAERLRTEAASAAQRQREADLQFINKTGRTLPASCQQKAVRHVMERLQAERLVTE